MRWTTDRVRQSFLDFFADKGHKILPSAPLIPQGDPTLLFTNAGMVPFKDYFIGTRTPAERRVADCQKCLRISGKHNDLEAVGRDTYHHTFFEMLGNWSFGDYYKPEAIAFHWELITKVWGIPAERLYATVYKDDDEARQAWLGSQAARDWRAAGLVPEDRILAFGEKDNFWEMGETGPCGPCSEIHIDRGPEAAKLCGHAGVECGVNVDGCERYIELGNLVFIQYNRDASGALTPLPMRHVDTGTGLERVTAVLQGMETNRILGNYDIDVFHAIIRSIEEWVVVTETKTSRAQKTPSKFRYGKDPEMDVSYRAIADHARAICFLIADGVTPSNTDRGYVLRRIIRRAARHGRHLGISRSFLPQVCESVQQEMAGAYPELMHASISRVVVEEEARFNETLDRGLELIETERKHLKAPFAAAAGLKLAEAVEALENNEHPDTGLILPGEVAFRLYDTYGFPLDLIQDILREDRIEVDVDGFDRLMEQQRERGRAARREEALAPELMLNPGVSSRFIGYDRYDGASEVLSSRAEGDDSIAIVAAETPFYPEGGGQVGDRGVIEGANGALVEVVNTRRSDGSIVHVGRMIRGEPGDIREGARVTLKVDRIRRDAARLNHSATHILHYALREILGKHVRQAGSLVAPDRLRFDFSHSGPIGEGDLATIEEEINARIRENAAVSSDEMAYDDAIKAGALAFFGDKYGDRVRVIRMGDFSVELCGGTHVDRTGDIGLFKLEGESGVAAGVRRVEAHTGQGALEAIRRREQLLAEIGGRLGAQDGAALERLERLLAREKELERKMRALEQRLVAGAGASAPAERVTMAGEVKVVTRKLEGAAPGALREIADQLRNRHGSAVIALGSVTDDKVALLVAVTPDLTGRIKAGEIIRTIAPIVGGSGGGRADLAQAGGRDAAKLDDALDRVVALVAAL